MPSDERPVRRGAELTSTIGVLVAVFAALLPLTRVVRPGSWLVGVVVLVVTVLAAGFIARRYRLPPVAVSAVEASVWVVFMMLVFLRATGLLWVIPTPETARVGAGLLSTAAAEIAGGAAPLDAGLALSMLIVGGTGLLAIIIGHLVLTARMPLLAAMGLIAVWLIPPVAVPGDVDIMAFVLLAVAILFLMRSDTSSREEPHGRRSTATAGVPASAIAIAAVAMVVTLVGVPMLTPPVARVGSVANGGGPGMDATLRLGADLRRPREYEVMRVRTSAPTVPYLRDSTVSQFDGVVWAPDRVRTVSLDSDEAFSGVAVDDEIELTKSVTTVEVITLASPRLPVPYPAVEVSGLRGRWSAVPYNSTVLTEGGTAQGQSYEVVTIQPQPTLEQIRARSAGPLELPNGTTELPPDLPPIVSELATQLTAESTNDYDALIALQTWFRSPEFSYSFDAPVEEGFDGSGVEVVGQFLEKREGYCIHFASAFALMARTLGMPSRVVQGYLPGSATSDAVERETVYSVSSDQEHAWPEVLFEGIGWVAFEPTNSLGVATSFSPAQSLPGIADDAAAATPAPTASSTLGPSLSPEESSDGQSGGEGEATSVAVNPLPALSLTLGILFVLAIPALIRELTRRRLLAAARSGDAGAAWLTVQDAAIDLGIEVPASETARTFGTRLVQQHGAPAAQMGHLISAIERTSYAPGGGVRHRQGRPMADDAIAVRSAMLASVDTPRRLLALLVPRSLIVRPDTAHSASGSIPRAR
jgi:transglutaminase-like putative cysteine protease